MSIPTVIVGENNIPLNVYLPTGPTAILWMGQDVAPTPPSSITDLTTCTSLTLHLYQQNGVEQTHTMTIQTPLTAGQAQYLLQSADIVTPSEVQGVVVGVFSMGDVCPEGGTIKWRLGLGFRIEAEVS